MKTTFKIYILAFAVFIGSATLISCTKNENNQQHSTENELITRVEVWLVCTDSAFHDSIFCRWDDPDGLGGNNPILPDTLNLKPNKNYTGLVKFGFEQNGVFQYINQTIENESENHLLCYEISSMTMPPNVALSIKRTDKDKNGLELGLTSYWETFRNDQGGIQIRLKHQPGIKNGSCDVGETDVEVNFPYVIQ